MLAGIQSVISSTMISTILFLIHFGSFCNKFIAVCQYFFTGRKLEFVPLFAVALALHSKLSNSKIKNRFSLWDLEIARLATWKLKVRPRRSSAGSFRKSFAATIFKNSCLEVFGGAAQFLNHSLIRVMNYSVAPTFLSSCDDLEL